LAIDYNTIGLSVLSFVVLVLIVYELRKPRVVEGINPQSLLERLDEIQLVRDKLREQRCIKCNEKMTIEKFDLGESASVIMNCPGCNSSLSWIFSKATKQWQVKGQMESRLKEKTKSKEALAQKIREKMREHGG